jgi:hypothetical protein
MTGQGGKQEEAGREARLGTLCASAILLLSFRYREIGL